MVMNNRPADRLAIALAQLNPVVGDCAGNAEKVRRASALAHAHGFAFTKRAFDGAPPSSSSIKEASAWSSR